MDIGSAEVLIQTVLVLVNSLMASTPASRPDPEFPNPPNGAMGEMALYVLTQTIPALMAPATRWTRDTSAVKIPAARPNSVSLAMATASASVSKESTDMTGPKSSTRVLRMSWSGHPSTVGR